jgi:hypothetical protein
LAGVEAFLKFLALKKFPVVSFSIQEWTQIFLSEKVKATLR